MYIKSSYLQFYKVYHLSNNQTQNRQSYSNDHLNSNQMQHTLSYKVYHLNNNQTHDNTQYISVVGKYRQRCIGCVDTH